MIYTGFLASERGLAMGVAVACIGIIALIKPALEAVNLCRKHFHGGPRPHGRRITQKIKTGKVHLKVVKSEDDKPTIH